MTRRDFLAWEKASRDTIDVKRVYCDLAGGLVAGVVLSQIVYWHMPNKKDYEPKLRARKDGELWLAKNHSDWWQECRISPKQAAMALESLGRLIIVKNSMFNGKRTPFIRLNWKTFLRKLKQQMDRDERSKSVLTKGHYRSYRKVTTGFDKRSRPITETTSETTSETTTESPPSRPPKGKLSHTTGSTPAVRQCSSPASFRDGAPAREAAG